MLQKWGRNNREDVIPPRDFSERKGNPSIDSEPQERVLEVVVYRRRRQIGLQDELTKWEIRMRRRTEHRIMERQLTQSPTSVAPLSSLPFSSECIFPLPSKSCTTPIFPKTLTIAPSSLKAHVPQKARANVYSIFASSPSPPLLERCRLGIPTTHASPALHPAQD